MNTSELTLPEEFNYNEYLEQIGGFTDERKTDIDNWVIELAYSIGFEHGYQEREKTEKSQRDFYYRYPSGGFNIKVCIEIAYSVISVVATIYTDQSKTHWLLCKSKNIWRKNERCSSDEAMYEAYKYAMKALKKLPYTQVTGSEEFGNCDGCGKFSRLKEHSNGLVCNLCEVKFDFSSDRRRKDEGAGFVYVIGDSELGVYKIGCSRNPKSRLYAMGKTKGPLELEIVCAIPVENKYEAEGKLHTRFSDKRKRGEWFLLDKDDIDSIQSMADF